MGATSFLHGFKWFHEYFLYPLKESWLVSLTQAEKLTSGGLLLLCHHPVLMACCLRMGLQIQKTEWGAMIVEGQCWPWLVLSDSPHVTPLPGSHRGSGWLRDPEWWPSWGHMRTNSWAVTVRRDALCKNAAPFYLARSFFLLRAISYGQEVSRWGESMGVSVE